MNFDKQFTHKDAQNIACLECGAQIGEDCKIVLSDDEKVRNPDPPSHKIRFGSLTSAMIIEEYLANSTTRT